MNLAAYLHRIRFEQPVSADLPGLRALHRAHLHNISYENLDVLLGRRSDLDIERIYRKIVDERRGGWCYEMNGLFGWALAEAGFDVTRLVGGVMASLAGEASMGSHLVLRVQLDEPYLADVGLGDGLLEPIPIRAGEHQQRERAFRLEEVEDDRWRFHNHEGCPPPNFDFGLEPDEKRLANVCEKLRSDPNSMFMQNLMCIRADPAGGTKHLVGRVLALPRKQKRILPDAEAFLDTLERHFELSDPEFAELWPKVCARHEEMFGDRAAAEIPVGPSSN
jgi:N-hydroxyarylamine O-acetyltransferase